MQIPSIALKTSARQFSQLCDLAGRVIASLTGNLNFTTPGIPISTLQTALTSVINQLTVVGPKHNRGGHAAYASLVDMSNTLHMLLKAEANYVETVVYAMGLSNEAMAAVMATSGFELKATRRPQGPLQVVQKLRFVASGALNRNQTKMVWEQPLEVTSHNNVKSNNVYRSATTNFADAVQIDTVSKKEFIDTNNTGAVITWSYFIAAVGAAGEGAVSNPITITLLPA